MSALRIRNVFGPVPSRRLGRSLGVDLVPLKVCSYDCVYCQLGRTTEKTIQRREFVPVNDILMELEERLAAGARADYVTLSGSGEPTLHSRLGEIIVAIKALTRVPVAVLTNGSLLGSPAVREELMAADVVVPSLDAGDADAFQRVNRPHPGIGFEQVVEGLVAFSHAFANQLWLEVFLLDGLNDSPEQVRRIAEIAARVRTDRIQINTAIRPPAEEMARPVPPDRLEELAALFSGAVEIIGGYSGSREEHEFAARRESILGLLERRPCTLEDLAAGLGTNQNEILKYVDGLLTEGVVKMTWRNGARYFVVSTL